VEAMQCPVWVVNDNELSHAGAGVVKLIEGLLDWEYVRKTYVCQWGEEGHGDGQFNLPFGICVSNILKLMIMRMVERYWLLIN
jgi:hypothetical protein